METCIQHFKCRRQKSSITTSILERHGLDNHLKQIFSLHSIVKIYYLEGLRSIVREEKEGLGEQ